MTDQTMTPLRRQTLIACDPETALTLWTEEIGAWWPVGGFSVHGEGSTVAFAGDEIVETAPDGRTALWGTVTDRSAASISFTWHPGFEAERASHVTVTFTRAAGADLTLVTLIHTGWERFADPAASRANYAGGWIAVLGAYAASRPGAAADTWLVLEHTAGPAAPAEGVFASPHFPKHRAFIETLRDEGVLVAAGPLPDAPGTGMTIVRAHDAESARALIVRAESEDGSVAAGLLDLRARPWAVNVHG